MVVNRTKLALPIRHSPAEETASAVAPSSARPSAKRPVAGVLEHLTPRNGTTSLQQPIQLAITDAAVPRNRISLPNAHQPKPSVVNSEARRVSPQIKAALDAGLQRWLFSSAETRGKTRQNLPPGSERRDIEAITGNLIRNVIIRKYPGKRDVYQVLHEDGTLNGRFTVSTRANGKLIIEATMKAGAYDGERTSPYSQTDFNALLGMDPMLDSYPRSILALPLHLQSEPLDALISQIRLLDDPLEKQQAFGDCYTAVLQLPPEDRSKLLGAFCHQIEHLSANVHAWAWDCLHLANQRLPAAQQDVETSVALSMVLLVLNMSDDERDLRMNLIDPGASERILNEDSD